MKNGLNVVTILRRSMLGVTARALGGASHLLFGFLAFIAVQVFPDTAIDEFLERWSAFWGIFRKEKTFAEFDIDLTGTTGTTIPINTVYQRDDGFEYTTDAEETLAAGIGSVKLVASTAGEDGNLDVGQTISIQSPIAGLDSIGTVATIIIDAEDDEENEPLRARLVDRIQQPPSGGAANDYIQWALSIAGVTRAWVLPQNLGPGTVGVAIVEDGEVPITATPAKITETQDYIDSVRPVTADVTVTTPVLAPMDLTIQLQPNTASVQAAVETELEDLIFRDSALEGAFKTPTETHTGEILLSRIDEAISIAFGEEDHLITVINAGAPADVVPGTNELITLGTITWQALP